MAMTERTSTNSKPKPKPKPKPRLRMQDLKPGDTVYTLRNWQLNGIRYVRLGDPVVRWSAGTDNNPCYVLNTDAGPGMVVHSSDLVNTLEEALEFVGERIDAEIERRKEALKRLMGYDWEVITPYYLTGSKELDKTL